MKIKKREIVSNAVTTCGEIVTFNCNNISSLTRKDYIALEVSANTSERASIFVISVLEVLAAVKRVEIAFTSTNCRARAQARRQAVLVASDISVNTKGTACKFGFDVTLKL